MENGDRPAGPIFYLVAALVLVIDQITKQWIVHTMILGQSIEVVGTFFRLTYVLNDAAAFGLQLGGRWSFIVVTVVVSAFILFYYTRSERTLTARWALALILGGALGNLADRVRLGEVVDFLHVSVAGFSWPIFNVADIGVSVGVGLLAIHLFRKEGPSAEADGSEHELSARTHDPGNQGDPA
ncbi:MAG: signal peptidase II [Gemmatimonadetes bacterium]|nr:signal peptidase II [Gemmatimonadota bacterium]